MGDLDDIVQEFLVETKEGLDRLDLDLVELERSPSDAQLLGRIFRCAHTIKGTSSFFGFKKLEAVTHAGENILSRLRDGALALTPEHTSGLLQMVDAIREMCAAIEADGTDGETDRTELVAQLQRLLTPGASPPPSHLVEAPAAPPAASPTDSPLHSAAPAAAPVTATAQPSAVPTSASVAVTSSAPAAPARVSAAPPHTPPAAAHPTPAKPAKDKDAPAEDRSGAGESLRVGVPLINKLMNLVGELVLTRNELVQANAAASNNSAASQRLNLIVSELQQRVMHMRMQPLDSVLSKFPRMVRDLAIGCGKEVRLEMEGGHTELDKTLIEAMKDPLAHILRNSIDHGIESAERRLAAGKPAEGRVLIRAYHEGGQVVVEISDDGGGISFERVRKKALEKGLIRPEVAEAMSQRELVNLIFLPGFSTAEQVTNVSGRGVGMDVVKTNVDRIGGTVEAISVEDVGTTFKIRIPLTLAIVPALVVIAAGSRFAIPQVNLVELVRIDREKPGAQIEYIHGSPVYRLRGVLLPIIDLRLVLGKAASEFHTVNLVVLQLGARQFGLMVDKIVDTQEIVVKPLAPQLKGIAAFSGATLLGDGRVALILDVAGIARLAHLGSEIRERETTAVGAAITGGPKTKVLLVKSADDGRMAIPLSRVSRLETIQVADVESLGGREMVQYRGEIMPIVRLSDIIVDRRAAPRYDEPPAEVQDWMNVVVVSHANGSIGVVIDTILDIADEALVFKKAATRPGIAGSVILAGRITEILDLDWVLASAGVDVSYGDSGGSGSTPSWEVAA
jgi:two-component system chemotaxis sensor kinase CheA